VAAHITVIRIIARKVTDVPLRILSLILLTTTLMFAMGHANQRTGAGAAQAAPCAVPENIRTLTLTVPANRAVTFPLVEVFPTAEPHARVNDAMLALSRADDSLRFAAANITADAEAHLSPSGLTFVPEPGFIGTSSGWILALPAEDAGLRSARDCAGSDESGRRFEAVRVNFEVRNELPLAFDDQIAVPSAATLLDVGPEAGVLANDVDTNGDRLVVHAAGVTTFPWGSVDLAADGSYRVVITDHELLRPSAVRYLVWDQQGSPTSVDAGVLEIDFTTE
jgi:hypothetical protein